MEQQDLLNRKVGDKEIPRLEPKDVEVQGMRVDKIEKDGKKVADLLILVCKHPDRDELMELSKIKVLRNERARVVGLWYQIDKDDNIQKGSAIHTLMELAGVEILIELQGKKIPTIKQSEENDYLCIKGY